MATTNLKRIIVFKNENLKKNRISVEANKQTEDEVERMRDVF